jgi:hypothetical protein
MDECFDYLIELPTSRTRKTFRKITAKLGSFAV